MGLLLLWASSYSQQAPALDSLFQKPDRILSGLPAFSELDVDSEGNLLLLEPSSNRLHKYLAMADYDSSIFIGGKGVREEGFLNVAKVSARNRQNTYLLDPIERRLIVLNTNLKIVGELDFFELNQVEDQLEIFPVSFTVSPSGDHFILNRLDNKIYKVNAFTELENIFGGLDYGEGSLYNPVDLQIRQDNLLFVSDTATQDLQIYDFYGTFQYTLHPKTNFRWQRFSLFGFALICYSSGNLYLENLRNGSFRNFSLPGKKPLIDLCISKEFVYLLFENEVHLYRY